MSGDISRRARIEPYEAKILCPVVGQAVGDLWARQAEHSASASVYGPHTYVIETRTFLG